jgi:uncharacterized protein with von Willebrand factor type A (vWA) domain
VGSGNVVDLVRATEYAPVGRKQDFYQAARCLLVHRKQDLALFDEAFQVFWRKPASGQSTRDLRTMGEDRRYRKPQLDPPPDAGDDTEAGDDRESQATDSVDLTRTYSAREVLREKDFANYSPEEIVEGRRMLAELSWDLGSRRTRRWVPGRGPSLDLRKTFRLNLKYGGEPLDLARRRKKDKLRSLVLICDVSGSMEHYSRLLLHFIHTIAGGLDRVEAFLFATRLTRITRYLRYRSVDQAVTEVARTVPDWAGGTRIGQVLKTFNFQWARRVLGRGAVVLIISDGWDRGEPELLAKESSRLQRSCHRLIWLNPLAGSPTYQPLTRGMQAAIPYVDDFLPIHNLNSLTALARHLGSLSPQRDLGPAFRPSQTIEPEPAPSPEPEQDIDPDMAPTFRHPLWGRSRARQP